MCVCKYVSGCVYVRVLVGVYVSVSVSVCMHLRTQRTRMLHMHTRTHTCVWPCVRVAFATHCNTLLHTATHCANTLHLYGHTRMRPHAHSQTPIHTHRHTRKHTHTHKYTHRRNKHAKGKVVRYSQNPLSCNNAPVGCNIGCKHSAIAYNNKPIGCNNTRNACNNVTFTQHESAKGVTWDQSTKCDTILSASPSSRGNVTQSYTNCVRSSLLGIQWLIWGFYLKTIKQGASVVANNMCVLPGGKEP